MVASDMTNDPKELELARLPRPRGGRCLHGFRATRDELAAFLNELLEAERAGTGVAH